MTRNPTRSHLGPATGALATALALALLPAPAQAHPAEVFRGPLQDLQPTTVEPFDGARATLVMVPFRGSTGFVFGISGVDRGAAGRSFGAHLHDGPCVAGDGAAAGPHYNASTATPPEVSELTEVWLDFTVGPSGHALSTASVPFRPLPGTRSVVIHALPTDPSGAAGTRLACLPVVWE